MTCVIVPDILRQKIESLIDDMQKQSPLVEVYRRSLYEDFLAFYYENWYVPNADDVDFELAFNISLTLDGYGQP